MSDRVQQVLDGELPPHRLDRAEQSELAAYEEAVDTALAGLRAEPEPDLTEPVMRRVRELPEFVPELVAEPGRDRLRAIRDLWASLWRPRPVSFRLRPATGLVLAAGLALLLLAPWGLRDGAGPGAGVVPGSSTPGMVASTSSTAAQGAVMVHFRLEASGAERVQLVGDFTDWQPAYSLSEVREGVWSVVVPVQPGVHEYGFLVDGQQWTVDPFAPRVDDGFGGANSRLDVLGPVGTSL